MSAPRPGNTEASAEPDGPSMVRGSFEIGTLVPFPLTPSVTLQLKVEEQV